MSGRQWQPGDVAMVTDGIGEKRLARRGRLPTDSGECWWYLDANTWGPANNPASPVVVIDPEDREQVERLLKGFDYGVSDLAVRDMQASLRSLTEPPKVSEPTGLGAVVEDDEGQRWTRVGTNTGCWVPDGKGLDTRLWSEFRSPVRVLHDGWAGEQS